MYYCKLENNSYLQNARLQRGMWFGGQIGCSFQCKTIETQHNARQPDLIHTCVACGALGNLQTAAAAQAALPGAPTVRCRGRTWKRNKLMLGEMAAP